MEHSTRPRPRPTTAAVAPIRLAAPQGGVGRGAGSVEREDENAPRPTPHAPRPLPAGIEPMLHIDDLAELLSCSRRCVERMRSAGKVPKPDIHVGRCPRWKPATIRAWIDGGGKP